MNGKVVDMQKFVAVDRSGGVAVSGDTMKQVFDLALSELCDDGADGELIVYQRCGRVTLKAECVMEDVAGGGTC